MDSFLVRSSCMTYNHEPYIKEALNGFVIQQTMFPVVYTIVDDASTDRNAEMIREFVVENFDSQDTSIAYEKEMEYGHVTFARHKTNLNCYFAVIYLKENHYSQRKSKMSYLNVWEDTKYVALCEGDDYWTDPLKLQKQVDFLESHPDFSMCFHSAMIKNETKTRIVTTCDKVQTREYYTNDIFPGWLVPTASVVYRKGMIDGHPSLKHPEWAKYGDIVLFLKCTHMGRVWGLEDAMSVYRMTNKGAVLMQRNEGDYMRRLCRHYDFLMLNFPQIKHNWPNSFIAQYYYSVMRHPKQPSDVFLGFWEVLKHQPKLLVKKILMIK